MTDHQQVEGSSGTRSFLTCLGIGCGVVFVLVLIASIAGYLLKDKIRDSMVDGVYESLEREISVSQMDSKEKGEVLGQMQRLRDGIKADRVSMEELGELMEEFSKSPLKALVITTPIRAGMSDASFSTEERAEGDDVLERYVAGRVNGLLNDADDSQLAELAGLRQDEGGFHVEVNNGMQPKEVRAAIAWAKTKVEAAGVDTVEKTPDLSGALKDLLDPVLD